MFQKLSLAFYFLLILLAFGIEAQQKEDFILACKTGNMKVVKRTIKDGLDINSKVLDDGTTALMLASAEGQEEVLNFLIENGANVNATRLFDYSPLMLAIQKNQTKIAQVLLEKSANFNAKNKLGETPFLLAVEKCNVEIAKLLIDKGADFASKTIVGQEPMQIAAIKGCTEMVALLLEYGFDVNEAKNKTQTTTLMTAAKFGHSDLVKLLLERGAAIDTKNRSGNTALMLAVQHGQEQVIQQLLDAGAQLNEKNILGYAPLLYAVDFHQENIVKLLIEKGADVNAEANSNITAISLAKKDKDSVLVAYLKEHGAVEVDSTKQKSPSFTANIVNPTPPISIGTSASPQDSIFAAKEEGTKPNVAVIDKNVNIDSQNKPKDVVNIMEVLASPDSQIINKPQIVAQDSAAIKAVSAPAAKVAEADSNKNLINQKPASQTIDDSKPHPIGGFEAIRANLKIPQLVKDGKIKGTILINVTVDQKGVLKDIKFVKLLMNKECNAAALEAVRSVKWESGTKDGKPVTASIDVPIEFQP